MRATYGDWPCFFLIKRIRKNEKRGRGLAVCVNPDDNHKSLFAKSKSEAKMSCLRDRADYVTPIPWWVDGSSPIKVQGIEFYFVIVRKGEVSRE